MSKAQSATVVSETVDAPADAVYAFARRMENLPRWASGLAQGIEQHGNAWIARSPMGRVAVRMAPPNPFGVLDHEVALPDGTRTLNAFRVAPCGEGSVLLFVALRPDGADDAAFASDVAQVRRDLAALKRAVESMAAED